MNYSCRDCERSDLTAAEMRTEKYLHSNRRGICKQCYRTKERVNVMIRKADKNPQDYLSCNSCDAVFSKYQSGTPLTHGKKSELYINGTIEKGHRWLKTECPYCQSDELERY